MSYTLPLPSRAMAPSGSHCGESSSAKVVVNAKVAVNNRVRGKKSVNFFIWISPFAYRDQRSLLLKIETGNRDQEVSPTHCSETRRSLLLKRAETMDIRP